MIYALQRAANLFIDGTFRTAPLPYAQLVTVHELLHGHVMPLVASSVTGSSKSELVEVIPNSVNRKWGYLREASYLLRLSTGTRASANGLPGQ